MSWVATVFISGVSVIYIFLFFLIFILLISSLLIFLPEKFGYIINRLISFIDPTRGDQFQSSSALDAIKLGGLKGTGMGEGILKDSVPEAHTDYIIAIISEEYGSIISILIITIFLYIAFRIIKICILQKDEFLKASWKARISENLRFWRPTWRQVGTKIEAEIDVIFERLFFEKTSFFLRKNTLF